MKGKGKTARIQWHPGFVAAMNLEFVEQRSEMIMEREHNLNLKPLEIDLLVIKKSADLKVRNEIGHFFRGHNIVEYKLSTSMKHRTMDSMNFEDHVLVNMIFVAKATYLLDVYT